MTTTIPTTYAGRAIGRVLAFRAEADHEAAVRDRVSGIAVAATTDGLGTRAWSPPLC